MSSESGENAVREAEYVAAKADPIMNEQRVIPRGKSECGYCGQESGHTRHCPSIPAKHERRRYRRIWPLPPRVNLAIKEHRCSEAQDDLDRWFLTWLVVVVAVLLLSVLAGMFA